MSNLFSIFDPTSISSIPLNWLSLLFVLMVFPLKIWLSDSQVSLFFKKILLSIHGEFSAIFMPLNFPGLTFLSVTLFFSIFLNNLMGLFPYIFTATSHISISISLALPLWIGHMLFSWFNQPIYMLAHLVPQGTPGVLIPFMVLIELVSNLIRPITLSVRLAANMVAGHLLLTLLGTSGVSSSFSMILFIMVGLFLMMLLELAVAVIQAYVFSILMTLYLNDVLSLNLIK